MTSVTPKLTVAEGRMVSEAKGARTEDGRVLSCSGCSVLLRSSTDECLYFWHYGASEGFFTAPRQDESPYLDFGTGLVLIDGQWYDTTGQAVEDPYA